MKRGLYRTFSTFLSRSVLYTSAGHAGFQRQARTLAYRRPSDGGGGGIIVGLRFTVVVIIHHSDNRDSREKCRSLSLVESSRGFGSSSFRYPSPNVVEGNVALRSRRYCVAPCMLQEESSSFRVPSHPKRRSSR